MNHENRTDTVSSLSGYRLLIVEDEYFIAEDLSRTLRLLGAVIIGPAPAVAGARSLLKALRPHCILLNINLADEDSSGFAQEVRALGTPVILITGYDRSSLPQFTREFPLLRKPVGTLDLVQTIRSQTPHSLVL